MFGDVGFSRLGSAKFGRVTAKTNALPVHLDRRLPLAARFDPRYAEVLTRNELPAPVKIAMVLGACHNAKILSSVVETVSIHVVHLLRPDNVSPQFSFEH